MREEPALAVEAAAEPGQGAVRADHPVAGHHDGDRVAAIGKPHRPAGAGLPEPRRESAIARGGPHRNPAQLGPDPLLERRPGGPDPNGVRGLEVA